MKATTMRQAAQLLGVNLDQAEILAFQAAKVNKVAAATNSGNLSGRLTMPQVAQVIGVNLGTLIRMRGRGSSIFDSSLPSMTGGTFSVHEVASWMAVTTAQATANPPTVTPVIAPTEDLK